LLYWIDRQAGWCQGHVRAVYHWAGRKEYRYLCNVSVYIPVPRFRNMRAHTCPHTSPLLLPPLLLDRRTPPLWHSLPPPPFLLLGPSCPDASRGFRTAPAAGRGRAPPDRRTVWWAGSGCVWRGSWGEAKRGWQESLAPRLVCLSDHRQRRDRVAGADRWTLLMVLLRLGGGGAVRSARRINSRGLRMVMLVMPMMLMSGRCPRGWLAYVSLFLGG
jgi:hypothetical protein